jgi:transcriptional regulator with PAS, ATPase and Fis domain
MNCAAVPDTLLESELFGHEAGAFTDAKERRKGKFEMADGGTLFFDEIGDMSMKTQAKLLRVLQDWQFERLGGTKTLEADVRVVSATNKDLRELAEDGSFRRDLYYRLAVVEIYIPALRERPDDIIPLAEHFLQAFNEKHGKSVGGIAPEVETLFLRHSWPGNVRELKNVVERAVIFCEGDVLGTQDLPAQYHEELPEHVAGSFREVHEAVSKQMILDALRQCNGVKHRAAEMLNMHRKTLYNKMKRLGIDS